MEVNDFILGLHYSLGISAAFVSVLSIYGAYKFWNKKRNLAYTYLGISLGWLSVSLRGHNFFDWLQTNLAIFIICSIAIVGAILHLRTFTYDRYKNKVVILSTISVCIITLLVGLTR